MLAEAHAELGIPQRPRHFALMCDFDPPHTLPLGDGTVGVPAGERAGALSESG
jgi:hypothetical protein